VQGAFPSCHNVRRSYTIHSYIKRVGWVLVWPAGADGLQQGGPQPNLLHTVPHARSPCRTPPKPARQASLCPAYTPALDPACHSLSKCGGVAGRQ
jgi:hypothetical protein